MGGTVGSRLTPGSCQGRHKPEKPDPDPVNPGKTRKTKVTIPFEQLGSVSSVNSKSQVFVKSIGNG